MKKPWILLVLIAINLIIMFLFNILTVYFLQELEMFQRLTGIVLCVIIAMSCGAVLFLVANKLYIK